ncbi:hypothetical protein JQ633_12465 [Bradyrhizobium tropiciagri]|uniref:hypothetical protein n=1 Tax=Bradyrhizobium tropiciagri TaxID=312253 RepID=UPI001BA8F28D|nr:hypothetical protein [Bradyrhizobium tropiciagri]MBR0871176.1 hypothetical protein [Bradyrhizobium tropiciagri]
MNQATAAVDIQSFCAGPEQRRIVLQSPFTRGAYTYATDGHILIRVDRLDSAPIDDKIAAEKVLIGLDAATFAPVGTIVLAAKMPAQECNACEGRGTEHDCPRCECQCEACGGRGSIDPERTVSVDFAGAIFALKYVRQLLSLPNVEIAFETATPGPLLFRFDGGVGALMRCATRGDHHVALQPSTHDPI